MSAIINWSVLDMSCYPEYEGESDVVFRVSWACNGVEVSGDTTYTANINNVCAITLTSGSPFTPYAQLTQEQVLGWCWENGVDKAIVEAGVQDALNAQINPSVVNPPLPWVPPAPPIPPIPPDPSA